MPFTISHAGFVLPLRHALRPSLMGALMIGAMVPDFGYFVREFGVAARAHTLAGAFCVSLPIGLAVFGLASLWFRRVAASLPAPHSGYLRSWGFERPASRRAWLEIAVAIGIGALSHNFVDSFTHASGVAVAMFPALERQVLRVAGEPVQGYRVLQYFGSVLGLGMLLVAYSLGLRKYCLSRKCRVWQDRRAWLRLSFSAGSSLVAAGVLNAKWLPRELDFTGMRVFGFQFLITWLPLFGALFLGGTLFRTATTEDSADKGEHQGQG